MTKNRKIRAPRTVWTPEQEAILTARYPDEKTATIAADIGFEVDKIYRKAKALGLSKSDEFMASDHAGRIKRGRTDQRMIATQFPKGHAPANKGLRRPGYTVGRMAETQFKKGQKPYTWRPIGTERYSKEGYLQVKLTDTGITRRDYVAVHLLVWELHRGEIPLKHHVSFKDGDRTNIIIENLELVSFADMMKRNTLHNYPKPIAELIQLRGALQRKINRREKDERPGEQ